MINLMFFINMQVYYFIHRQKMSVKAVVRISMILINSIVRNNL